MENIEITKPLIEYGRKSPAIPSTPQQYSHFLEEEESFIQFTEECSVLKVFCVFSRILCASFL